MKCSYCGKEVIEGSKFCDGCGAKLEGGTSKQEEIVYYQPKKSKTGLIVAFIIIGILLIAGIIVTIILLNSGGKNNNSNNSNNGNSNNNNNNSGWKEENKKEESKTTDEKDLISNVKYTDEVLDNGDIIVFIENKNTTEVSFTLDIEYYDEEGTKVDSNYDAVIGLPSKEKTVLRFYRTEREYKNYELHAKNMNGTFFSSQYKDVSITSKDDKEKEEIVVTLKNNSSKKIESAKVAVVFYKNNKIVGYSYDSEYEIEGNKAVALYINYPYDIKYDEVEFDSFEAYLVEAYSSKF